MNLSVKKSIKLEGARVSGNSRGNPIYRGFRFRRNTNSFQPEIRRRVSRRARAVHAIIARILRVRLRNAPFAVARGSGGGSVARAQAQTIISLINPVGLAWQLIIRRNVKATLVDTRDPDVGGRLSSPSRDLAASNIPVAPGSRPIKRSFCAATSP